MSCLLGLNRYYKCLVAFLNKALLALCHSLRITILHCHRCEGKIHFPSNCNNYRLTSTISSFSSADYACSSEIVQGSPSFLKSDTERWQGHVQQTFLLEPHMEGLCAMQMQSLGACKSMHSHMCSAFLETRVSLHIKKRDGTHGQQLELMRSSI